MGPLASTPATFRSTSFFHFRPSGVNSNSQAKSRNGTKRMAAAHGWRMSMTIHLPRRMISIPMSSR